MALSRTARYYRKNKKARLKHRATSAKAQKKPAAVKKRVEANRFNRKHGRKGDGLDASHQKDGSIRLEKAKTNRARGGGKKR